MYAVGRRKLASKSRRVSVALAAALFALAVFIPDVTRATSHTWPAGHRFEKIDERNRHSSPGPRRKLPRKYGHRVAAIAAPPSVLAPRGIPLGGGRRLLICLYFVFCF